MRALILLCCLPSCFLMGVALGYSEAESAQQRAFEEGVWVGSTGNQIESWWED